MYMERKIIFDKELTILMPCLNEEKTIGICIKKAKYYLKKNTIHGILLGIRMNSEVTGING